MHNNPIISLPVAGLLLIVNVSLSITLVRAEEIVIDPWIIPIDNLPYPTRSAVQGDIVSFHYSGNHNVYVALHSSSEPPFRCDTQDDVIPVGVTGGSSANYTLPMFSDDSSSQSFTSATFFCNYTSHCERGQLIQFNIYPSRDDIPPTQAPSTMPTMLPTTSVPSILPTFEVTAPPFAPLFNTTFAPTPGLSSGALRSPMRTWNSINAVSLLSIFISVYYLLS